MFREWKKNKYANFKDKTLQLAVAVKLARHQKLVPSLADVIYQLLLDGEAYFNPYPFEEWAKEFGYDPDSRKAEAIFRVCDETGRALARCVPSEILAKAREILKDF